MLPRSHKNDTALASGYRQATRWNKSLDQRSSVLCCKHLVTSLSLIISRQEVAQGTESVLLDREGARQTVVGENSDIFLLDTILQGRLGSGKNSPVSHVKQSKRHTRIPELGDTQSPCLAMNICTTVQVRHVSLPQLRLSKPKLDGRTLRLRSTQRTVAWCLCLPRIANVLVFSIRSLSNYPAPLSGAVY